MSKLKKVSGSCVCGAVRVSAESVTNEVGACHCRTCRKWGGGPFMELNCGSNVQISGETNVSVFSSSEWAERGFCSQCGSHLFYRLKENNIHMVPIGLLDEEHDFEFTNQVFIDEKPEYYQFKNKTEELTGEELFAKFTASQN